MPTLSKVRGWIAYVLCVQLLLGCAYLGLATPTTFNERFASAQASVTAARLTAAQLLAAKKITVNDAVNVQGLADNTREALDIARSFHKTSPAAGESKLTSALTILKALESYLATREAK